MAGGDWNEDVCKAAAGNRARLTLNLNLNSNLLEHEKGNTSVWLRSVVLSLQYFSVSIEAFYTYDCAVRFDF